MHEVNPQHQGSAAAVASGSMQTPTIPERSFSERYRALRGLVLHVVRNPQRGLPGGIVCRNPASGASWGRGLKGSSTVCVWCRLPVAPGPTGRARRWHRDCVSYYGLANGGHEVGWSELVSARLPDQEARQEAHRCSCGEPGRELDHTLAIGVAQWLAAHLGRRVYALAFTLENLRWLCHACHAGKTGTDRQWMNDLATAPHAGLLDRRGRETPTSLSRREALLAAGQTVFEIDAE